MELNQRIAVKFEALDITCVFRRNSDSDPILVGQRSDFSRTVIRFNSDAVPIQFGQRSDE
jgi:hypothetical protein